MGGLALKTHLEQVSVLPCVEMRRLYQQRFEMMGILTTEMDDLMTAPMLNLGGLEVVEA